MRASIQKSEKQPQCTRASPFHKSPGFKSMTYRVASVARKDLKLQGALWLKDIRATGGEVGREGCFLSCGFCWVSSRVGLGDEVEGTSWGPEDKAQQCDPLDGRGDCPGKETPPPGPQSFPYFGHFSKGQCH